MKQIAAFFDIDGTLYRDSLMIEHFKKMITYDIIDESYWVESARKKFNDWDQRQGNYDDYLYQVSDLYVDSITNVSKGAVEFTADQVIKLKANRVYKFTRDKIKWHLNEGHVVIFISGSPDFLVKRMARKYKVHDYVGATYVVDNGVYTGEVIPMWDSKSKNKAIDEFVEKYNLDLEQSFAYGDTNGDISMLKRVGNPIAINPSKELLMNARKDEDLMEKLEIAVERKDIIYKLKANVDLYQP